MVKTFGANTIKDLETAINSWVETEKPNVLGIQYDADGVEFMYTALILYQTSPEVRR